MGSATGWLFIVLWTSLVNFQVESQVSRLFLLLPAEPLLQEAPGLFWGIYICLVISVALASSASRGWGQGHNGSHGRTS